MLCKLAEKITAIYEQFPVDNSQYTFASIKNKYLVCPFLSE